MNAAADERDPGGEVSPSFARRGNGPGHGGPARGYSWPPATEGNTLATKSGFWMSPLLRPDDRGEVEEIAASIRPLMPVYRPEFEPAVEQLACRIWRQRRAYRDLSDHGVVRDGQPASVLAHLAKLESAIARDLDAFGMTPRAAVSLGLDLLRGEQARLTVTRLAAMAAEEEAQT
jgi:hypothetical protein